MRKTSPTVIAVCVGLLWLGEAHAARFERHDTNPDVPVGTVYDTKTKLLWEQKTTDGGVHDVNSRYRWSDSGVRPDGGAFTEFLGALNDEKSSNGVDITGCFANKCDWRLPSIGELREILDRNAPGCFFGMPCIAPIFGPTQSGTYWSATTVTGNPSRVWLVSFITGSVGYDLVKTNGLYVRAVRSGL